MNKFYCSSGIEFQQTRGNNHKDKLALWPLKNDLEEYPTTRFLDIGAVIFYLQAVPWQIPGFEFQTYRKQLLALHKKIESIGHFEVKAHRFLIEAELRRHNTTDSRPIQKEP